MKPYAQNLSRKQLRKKAVAHYNDRQIQRAYMRDWYSDYDINTASTTGSDDAFYNRIEVNYLRHEGTQYDDELHAYFNKVGVRDAVDRVREHVYGLISAAYPHLKEECDRQLTIRRDPEAMLKDMRSWYSV